MKKNISTYLFAIICAITVVSCSPSTRSWNAYTSPTPSTYTTYNGALSAEQCEQLNQMVNDFRSSYAAEDTTYEEDTTYDDSSDSGFSSCAGCNGLGYSIFYGARQTCSGCGGSGQTRNCSSDPGMSTLFLIRH